jgi:hypothetical protein
MKKNTLIIIVLFSLLLGACQDFLDAKPEKNLVIPDTLDDYQALLDAEPRSMNSSTKLGFLSSDELVLGDPLVNLISLDERAAYLWTGEFYLPDDIGVDWYFSYAKVFYANIVIDGIRDYEPSSAQDQERAVQLDASARFYRAFGHFSVATQFMGAYDPSKPNAPGIPIRKTADINAASPRISAKEVFDFIRADLEIARNTLPDFPDKPTRASAWAAEALLSRICLYMQDYEAAFIHSSNALTIKDELMDFNQLNNSLRYIFPRFNKEVIHHAAMFTGRFTGNRQLFVSPELYNLYDSSDLRKELLFSKSTTPNRMNVAGRYTGDFLLFTGLATDEVMLDRAEAAARIGNDAKALEDLNKLLKMRIKSNVFQPIEGVSGKNLVKRIGEERRKELLFRGVRWLDLRRYNLDPEMALPLRRIWNTGEFNLAPNSERYVFPIPPREIRLNDKL